MEDTLQFFDRLLSAKDPAPTKYPFNHMFKTLVLMKNSNNHYATVISLFNRLTQTKGVSPLPDVIAYTMLIDYCNRMNRPQHGLIFFGRCIREGQRVDACFFTPILRGLCSDNRISEATTMVFNNMPKLGCTPNMISYNTVIDGLCKDGAVSEALSLFNRMLLDSIVPDVLTYNSVINGLCKEGETEKAEQMLCYMVS